MNFVQFYIAEQHIQFKFLTDGAMLTVMRAENAANTHESNEKEGEKMVITFLPDVLNKELLIKPISRKPVFVQMLTFKKE